MHALANEALIQRQQKQPNHALQRTATHVMLPAPRRARRAGIMPCFAVAELEFAIPLSFPQRTLGFHARDESRPQPILQILPTRFERRERCGIRGSFSIG